MKTIPSRTGLGSVLGVIDHSLIPPSQNLNGRISVLMAYWWALMPPHGERKAGVYIPLNDHSPVGCKTQLK